MKKYLKPFFKYFFIVSTTIILTISFSVIGSSFIKKTHTLSNNQTNENISNFIKNSCNCKTVEYMTKLSKNNELNYIYKNIYLLKGCDTINEKIISKKILIELIKNNRCSESNIEIILHNKKNNFSSFKINNCKILPNESF